MNNIQLFQKQKNKNINILENLIYVGDANLNTLIEDGDYSVICSSGSIKNQPTDVGNLARLNVKNCIDSGGYKYVFQTYTDLYRSCKRRSSSYIDQPPTVWYEWICNNFVTGGYLHIYISKNGNNNNTGLSPDFPVLTVNKTIEIANSITFYNSNSCIYLHFGKGDWGDITFNNLPYYIHICPYDGNTPTEYSEELPKFNVLSFTGGMGRITGIYSDIVETVHMYLDISIGYKHINTFYAGYNSYISVNNSSDVSNVYEIGNPSRNYIFRLGNRSTISMNYIKFRLSENITNAENFLDIRQASIWEDYWNTPVFDYNGYTFTGKKIYAGRGSNIITKKLTNNSGINDNINEMFGTGYYIERGTIINGFPSETLSA